MNILILWNITRRGWVWRIIEIQPSSDSSGAEKSRLINQVIARSNME